jgi:uncharacterized protein
VEPENYLKAEVWGEQLIRKIDPFRRFLEVAAQGNGKIVSFANIASDVGVDEKTIKVYYSILEDTLLGFYLEPFKNSFRKRLGQKPKFYFFDLGVVRALTNSLRVELVPSSSAYGEAFEHFVILELFRLSEYFQNDYKFSFILSKDGVEIDLVVERPAQQTVLVEIKSATTVQEKHLKNLIVYSSELKNSLAYCLCREETPRIVCGVEIFPWQLGIRKILELPMG